ncbi:hypothetical protein Tco_0052722 [Tanacetum coccineum]
MVATTCHTDARSLGADSEEMHDQLLVLFPLGFMSIVIFEPKANLDTRMVLHQGYLLGGSYHGHDSIFLLNNHGVQWQVEVKQTYVNAMSVVGPVWSDFTLPMVFVPKVYSTSQSDTVDLFIKDMECEVFIDYNLERMGWYYNWRWYTNHAYQKALSTSTNCADMLQRLSGFWRGQWVWFYLSNDTVWRIESYALKFADDVLMGIFMKVPKAWDKLVWTGVDDVFLLAPVLKHVVPSLVA